MPFERELDGIYLTVRQIVEERGRLTCLRADQITKSGRITATVIDHIKKARFLIADLTACNPNVFYELGVAHSSEKSVILLTQDENEIPFDLSDYRRINYDPNDLTGLTKVLPDYIRSSISTIPADWERTYRPQDWDGPYIKITSLRAPLTISLDEPFEITLKAKNTGAATHEGYFSVSFPDGVKGMRVTTGHDSKLVTKTGERGQAWSNGRDVLLYPIAEGYIYDDEKLAWPSGAEYFITVSGYAERKGFLWFHVNTACRKRASDVWKYDPEKPLLDIDEQRGDGEPVYCGVIDVVE